ncbi:ricin B-like lectin [Coprinellus micaceus]|uniref:Ricin B-like lectin n=1 Tax=Coprinellus micaceus TaxID=71717 RepID=A0A4Y7TSY7_COPMI|nr:ricin B-like lectin [Coprinellus micaceus]
MGLPLPLLPLEVSLIAPPLNLTPLLLRWNLEADSELIAWQPTPPPPNNGWYPPPPKGQTVQLHPNYNWKKCLDVKDGNFYNGAPVDIYDCNGGAGQNWVINQGNTRVQVAGQNFCLDAGDWPNNGSKMKIWNCYDGLASQSWFYTDDKRIALKDKGFCLDLTNGDTCNGNVMQIWSCTNWNANQIWST